MTRKKKIAVTAVLVLAGIMFYLFLFGKLFAYSPVIIGFEKHELTNSIIYSQKGVTFDDYEKIDTLIPRVEKFHELAFRRKPEILLFSDSIGYLRRSPSRARFCAFYNGRLFATPWALKEAQSGKISLEIYITHELSHSLLHQHSGLINAAGYPKWLMEGIAVYSADQMGTSVYPGREETYRMMKSGNFMPPTVFKTKNEDNIKLDVENRISFMYSEFACIVDYLVEKYGKEKLLVYMKNLTKGNDHNTIFRQIYGTDFERMLVDFRQYVLLNAESETTDINKQPAPATNEKNAGPI